MTHFPSIVPTAQKGYILFMTLIMLMVLTILALTQITNNTAQTRIAANASDTEVNFEKTEGALNEAINKLLNGTYSSANFLQNSNGLYVFNPNAAPLWSTINWTGTGTINSFQGNTSSQANYIIEQLPSIIKAGQNMKTPTSVYRITARSLTASGNTSVIIQTTLQVD